MLRVRFGWGNRRCKRSGSEPSSLPGSAGARTERISSSSDFLPMSTAAILDSRGMVFAAFMGRKCSQVTQRESDVVHLRCPSCQIGISRETHRGRYGRNRTPPPWENSRMIREPLKARLLSRTSFRIPLTIIIWQGVYLLTQHWAARNSRKSTFFLKFYLTINIYSFFVCSQGARWER